MKYTNISRQYAYATIPDFGALEELLLAVVEFSSYLKKQII